MGASVGVVPHLFIVSFAVLTFLSISDEASAQQAQVRTHAAHFGSSPQTRELGPPVDHTKRPRTVTVYEPDGFMALRAEMPFWEIGNVDKKLSNLCSTARFNQIDTNRVTIGFSGPVGPGVLGVALGDGYNLFDPTRAARAGDTYFFHRDRTGQCTVFFWNAEERRRRQGAVMYPPGYRRDMVDASYKRPDQGQAAR
jgi:hypothetical protein